MTPPTSDLTVRENIEAIRDAVRVEILASYATNLALFRQLERYANAALEALPGAGDEDEAEPDE